MAARPAQGTLVHRYLINISMRLIRASSGHRLVLAGFCTLDLANSFTFGSRNRLQQHSRFASIPAYLRSFALKIFRFLASPQIL
jgi:hypothetical protein